MQTMIEDGPGRDFRWVLFTADAHGLYEQFGFAAPDATAMVRPAGEARDRIARPAAAQSAQRWRFSRTRMLTTIGVPSKP